MEQPILKQDTITKASWGKHQGGFLGGDLFSLTATALTLPASLSVCRVLCLSQGEPGRWSSEQAVSSRCHPELAGSCGHWACCFLPTSSAWEGPGD